MTNGWFFLLKWGSLVVVVALIVALIGYLIWRGRTYISSLVGTVSGVVGAGGATFWYGVGIAVVSIAFFVTAILGLLHPFTVNDVNVFYLVGLACLWVGGCVLWILAPVTGYPKQVRQIIFVLGIILPLGTLFFWAVQSGVDQYVEAEKGRESQGAVQAVACPAMTPNEVRSCVIGRGWSQPVRIVFDFPVTENQYAICIDSPNGEKDYEAEKLGPNLWRYRTTNEDHLLIKYQMGANYSCPTSL